MQETLPVRSCLDHVSPQDLQIAWKLILPGILVVQKYSVAHWIPEDVYSAIRTGHSTLHIGDVGGDYAGFVVLTPSSAWDGKVLHMWCVYNASKYDVLTIFENDINRIAREFGAKRITFWSHRSGWERRIAKYGFVPNQVEFVKELKS